MQEQPNTDLMCSIKTCRVCHIQEASTPFVVRQNICKDCESKRTKEYRSTHREHRRSYDKLNENRIRIQQQRYKDIHRDRINERRRERYASDTLHRQLTQLRNAVSHGIRRRGYNKSSRTFELLGGDLLTVQAHLIQTAIRNYGRYDEAAHYHIDHIVPCVSAESKEELIVLQHYSNLQYLTPQDNHAKAGKLR